MGMTEHTRRQIATAAFVAVVAAAGASGCWLAYRDGYKTGQLDAAQGRLRWSVWEGIVVEFHGRVATKSGAAKEATK